MVLEGGGEGRAHCQRLGWSSGLDRSLVETVGVTRGGRECRSCILDVSGRGGLLIQAEMFRKGLFNPGVFMARHNVRGHQIRGGM